MKNLPLKFGKNAKNCKEIEKTLVGFEPALLWLASMQVSALNHSANLLYMQFVVCFYVKYISQYAVQIFDD